MFSKVSVSKGPVMCDTDVGTEHMGDDDSEFHKVVLDSPSLSGLTSRDPCSFSSGDLSIIEGPASKEDPISEQSKLSCEEVATRLFNGTLEGYDYDNTAQFIGRADEFSASVLKYYVDKFNFGSVNIDSCLRIVSNRLRLVGESQTVDRVLRAITNCYWSRNEKFHGIFINSEMVYTILFSLILLNTDLNVVGSNLKHFARMKKSTYIRNTLASLHDLYLEHYKKQNKEINSNAEKQWRQEMENILGGAYESIKKAPFLEEPKAKKRPNNNFSRFGLNFEPRNSLPRILSKITNDGKYNSILLLFPEVLSPEIRNLITASSTSNNTNCSGSQHKSTNNGSLGRSSSTVHSSSTESITKDYMNPKVHCCIFGRVIFRFVDIGDKFRSFKPFEAWITIVDDESKILELVVWELQPSNHGQRKIFDRTNSISNWSQDSQRWHLGKNSPKNPELSVTKDNKYIMESPKVFILLHSVTLASRTQKDNSYSVHIQLHNGDKYLITSPSNEFIENFKNTANRLAATKSIVSKSGSEGNVEYGWKAVPSNFKIGTPTSRGSANLSSSECHSKPGIDISSYMAVSPSLLRDKSQRSKLFKNPVSTAKDLTQRKSVSGKTTTKDGPKLKISKWHGIPSSVSAQARNTPSEQLSVLNAKLKEVEADIAEHSSHRTRMIEYYKNKGSVGNLSLSNWIKKQHYLTNEFNKYKVYVEVLSKMVLTDA